MQIESLAIKKSFNKAAATYDRYAQTQAVVGETLIKRLKLIRRKFDHAIDIGCGTGVITQHLADTIQYNEMEAIDTAESLLPHQDDLALCNDIDFFEMDFNDLIHDDHQYDLIFSNMALHWSEKFTRTLAALNCSLTKNGILAFTIPLKGTFCELEDSFQMNDFFDLDTVALLLQSLGYRLIYINELTYVGHFDNTRAALRSIKNTGAAYVRQRNNRSLSGKSLLANKNINRLSYVIGYFIAKKA